MSDLPSSSTESGGKTRQYISQSPGEHIEERPEITRPIRRWPAFVAGVVFTCLGGSAGVAVHHWLHRSEGNTLALSRSLAPLPEVLSAKALDEVSPTVLKAPDARIWIRNTSRQLKVLSALPPDWNLQYGNQLLEQAETLWPNNRYVMKLRLRWQQQLMMSAVPEMRLTGWQSGMARLQHLADILNAQDGRKEGELTVSELKSGISGAISDFRSAVPVEEQLRTLAVTSQSPARILAQRKDAEQHLHQLLARYSLTSTKHKSENN